MAYYTDFGIPNYITRKETKIGECPICKADIIEVYEKDSTPGFRESSTWIVNTCNCNEKKVTDVDSIGINIKTQGK